MSSSWTNKSVPTQHIWLLIPLVALAIWLGFPNDLYSLPPCALIWPLGLCAIGQVTLTYLEAFSKGWLAGFLGSFASLYWLYLPLSEVGGLPVPLALVCGASIASCISIQSGLYAALAKLLRNCPAWSNVILLSLGWYLLEYIFAIVAGFPWLPLSGALVQWPILVQIAGLVGAYFSCFIWLLPLFLLKFVVLGAMKPRPALPIAGLLIASILGYGAWRLDKPGPAQAGSNGLEAIIVEGNIDQNQKWLPAFQRKSLDTYITLTDKALANANTDEARQKLLIWPETALPFFFQRSAELAGETLGAVKRWGMPLLFGAPGVEIINGRDAVFNRAFLLAPDGHLVDYYDKEHLVPFGEYVPNWLNLDFLKALLQGVGIYEAGTHTRPLRYADLALGLLICYEGIFPWLAQERVAQGANILVDISNDGWFGHTPAPMQHLLLTSLRCIEQNRWLARATNTGLSAIIDPLGRITRKGGVFQAGYMEAPLYLTERVSVFHKIGKFLPWLALLAFCALLAVVCKLRLR